MPKNIRIRRSLVLAASLGAMAVAAPAAQAVEVKVVERPRADELFVTARAGVVDSLFVESIDSNSVSVRSVSTDTITLPAGSGCTRINGSPKSVRCTGGTGDRLQRALVKTGDLNDALVLNVASALVDLGSGSDFMRGKALLGGPQQLAVFGKTGNDTLINESPFNGSLLVGNEGNDILRGGAGPDRIEGGLDVDEISGGGGADRILVARDNNASDFVNCGDQIEAGVEADFADRLSVNCAPVTRI